ncbi:MAG: Flp pilus assembly protein CpaB, partial [Alphaproteobacteria bacterium]
MRKARVLVLMLAVLAAAAAVILVRSAGSRNAAASRMPETVDVLVAARNFTNGETVTKADVKWQPWPKNTVPKGVFQRSQIAKANILPAPTRFPILQGEPLSKAKFVNPDSGGAMASRLAAGMRAVPVQVRAESIAG